MSKRRLNTLKGKKLVTGDPNLMTKDEICINATPNGVEVKEIGTDGKIKDLAGSNQGSSEDNKGFQYKSNKICWEINPLNDEQKEAAISLLIDASVAPFYSAIYITYDGNYSNHVKYYGYQTQCAISRFCANIESNDLYIEESSSNITFNYNGEIIENLSFSNFIKLMEIFGMTEDMLYEMAGIKKISYEEYINRRVDKEIGKELVNE